MEFRSVVAPPELMLTGLVRYILPAIVIIGLSRALFIRQRARWPRVLTGAVLFGASSLVALMAVSFVYPHHHHNTAWGYPVDAAIGCALFALALLAWRLGGIRRRAV